MASGQNKTAWLPLETFAEMLGFRRELAGFENKSLIKWTNTASSLGTGGVHGLRYKVEKDKDGNPRIALQHWLHRPYRENRDKDERFADSENPEFIVLTTKTRTNEEGQVEIKPDKAFMGDDSFTDPADINKFMRFLQQTAKSIWRNISYNISPYHDFNEASKPKLTKRDEIPNLYDIAQDTGFNKPIRLEGMYTNGEFKFEKPDQTNQPPVFSRQLLRAMLGIEGSVLEKGDGELFTRSYSIADPDGGYEGISYTYKPDGKNGFSLNCDIWSTDESGKKEKTSIYNISFEADSNKSDRLILTDLDMLPDPHFAKPDLTDHIGVVRAIRAMKYIHLAILKGEMPKISQIMYQHDLKSYLRKPHKPKNGAENPRKSFELSTDPDKIGSNSVKMTRDFIDDTGEWVKQSIRLDAGASFTDPDDYYDSLTPDYSKDLIHPKSPHIKPDGDMLAFFITHEHEDHLRGLARQAKFNFDLPPLILNKHTSYSFKRMMSEEGVPKDIRDRILDKALIIDPRLDPDQLDYLRSGAALQNESSDEEEANGKKSTILTNPDNVEIHEFKDTVIEKKVETVWSENEQRDKHFPKLEIYSKKYPESRFAVRVGPAGHSAHAMMCEVDGVLYTGDYKLDQTLPPDQRTDLDWLAKCTAGVHFQESTNALKEDPNVPSSEVVRGNRKKILRDFKGQRVFADMIGSNAIDMYNFCDTLGELNEESKDQPDIENSEFDYIIFAGTAVQKKYSDLNKTHDLKNYMQRKYGIKTLQHTEKEGSTVQKLLKGDDPQLQGKRYAIIGTGTQDEPVSITHRVSRNLHPSINLGPDDLVLRLQAVIPVGQNFLIREKQNQRFREDLGCELYDANEEARKGNHIYHSGHTSKADLLLKHQLTKDPETGEGPLQILFHGSPDQKEGLKVYLEENGQRACIPAPQGVYQVLEDKRDIELVAEISEEWTGYREIRADPEQFFNKHRQQQTTQRSMDKWYGQAARTVERLETLNDKIQQQKYKPSARGANLHDNYDEGSKKFPGIGIYGLDKPGYVENYTKLGSIIAMDSETTGRDVGSTVPISSSFVAYDLNGKELGNHSVRHALPDYRIMGPGAAIVTGTTELKALHEPGNDGRLNSWEFARELGWTYRTWSGLQSIDPQEKPNAGFVTYRGTLFDDPVTMRMNGTQLIANDMKPMATHGNITVDLFNVYSALLALKPDEIGSKKDKDGNFIRTLEVACSKNGIKYENAHDDLADARMTGELFYKFMEMHPELMDQMFMNADFKSSGKGPMIDHILGQNQHPKDQAPVFGFVDRSDRKCRPRIGGLVTIDTKVSQATHAIALDLASADIHQLESLSDEELLKVMDDPEGPFSVIKLNQSPMLFPPEFIYRDAKVRQRAVGKVPKTTIMQRANTLKELRKYDEGPTPSFSQRVQDLYGRSKLHRRPSPSKNQSGNANLNIPQSANDNSQVPFQVPSQRIFTLFHLINNFKVTKNKHHRAANQVLRKICSKSANDSINKTHIMEAQETLAEDPHNDEKGDVLTELKEKMLTYDNDRENEEKNKLIEALDKIKKIDHQAQVEQGYPDPYIQDFKFLLEWAISDRYPEFLSKQESTHVNALKSAWLHAQVNEARQELEEIENDPVQFKKLVGKGSKAKQKWKELKANYLEYLEHKEANSDFKMDGDKDMLARKQWREDSDKEEMFARMRSLRRKKPGAYRPAIRPPSAHR